MWKNIGKAIAFLAIFALIFSLLSPVFVPKDNTVDAGIHAPSAKGFLGETPESIDVLFLGDSEAYSSFIPLRIWENYGIPSYVCSNGDQQIYECQSYLERFLRTQSPKVVVLETNTLYRDFTLAELLRHYSGEKLSFLRYHDRWKNLQPSDFGTQVEFTCTVRDKGYAYYTDRTSTKTEGYMVPSDEAEPVPVLHAEFVKLMQQMCQKEGAQLILVSTPSPTNWNIYYHNGVQLMADALGLTYIDMNLLPQQIPIDWTQDSYDWGDHLNYDGACKVTDYMGALLQGMGLFTDKRELEEYSRWNLHLAEFQELVNK